MKKRFIKNDINTFSKFNLNKTPKVNKKRPSKNLFSYREIPNSPAKIKDVNKLTFRKNEQNFNPNIQNNYNDVKTQRNLFSTFNQNTNNINVNHKRNISNGFQGTLPDALLMNPRPLRTSSRQKILLDTHANSNNFYPNRNIFYSNDSRNEGNGWHNQANNIMFNTNGNFFQLK